MLKMIGLKTECSLESQSRSLFSPTLICRGGPMPPIVFRPRSRSRARSAPCNVKEPVRDQRKRRRHRGFAAAKGLIHVSPLDLRQNRLTDLTPPGSKAGNAIADLTRVLAKCKKDA